MTKPTQTEIRVERRREVNLQPAGVACSAGGNLSDCDGSWFDSLLRVSTELISPSLPWRTSIFLPRE